MDHKLVIILAITLIFLVVINILGLWHDPGTINELVHGQFTARLKELDANACMNADVPVIGVTVSTDLD